MTYRLLKAASDVCRRQPIARTHPINTVVKVLMLWAEGQGEDTFTISKRAGISEAHVCLIISADADRRHASKRAA